MQFGYPLLIRWSFSKSSPIRFRIAESGWIVIQKPDPVQQWCAATDKINSELFLSHEAK